MSSDELKSPVPLYLASRLTVMAGATISPALPAISKVYQHLENLDLLMGMLLALPGIAIAFSAPFAGIFIDRTGRRKLLVVGLFFYAVFGTAGLYLNSIYVFLFSRALLGVAVGAIMTCSSALLSDYYKGDRLRRILGIQGSYMIGGGVVFTLLGGFLASIHWRYPFLIYATALFIIPLVLPVKDRYDPHSMKGYDENFFKTALSIWPLLLLALAIMTIFYLIPLRLPFFLKAIDIDNESIIGLVLSVLTLTGAFSSNYYLKIRSLMGRFDALLFTFFMQAVGFSIIYFSESLWQVIIALIIFGAGSGVAMPSLVSWVVSKLPEAGRGRGLGAMNSFFFSGQFFSPVFFSMCFIEQEKDYFLVAAVVASLMVAVFLVVGKRSQNRSIGRVSGLK